MSDDTATDVVAQRIAQLMIEYLSQPVPTQEEKDRDLRNWYAGLAMQGWLVTHTDLGVHHPARSSRFLAEFAADSFAVADAMLRASKELPK